MDEGKIEITTWTKVSLTLKNNELSTLRCKFSVFIKYYQTSGRINGFLFIFININSKWQVCEDYLMHRRILLETFIAVKTYHTNIQIKQMPPHTKLRYWWNYVLHICDFYVVFSNSGLSALCTYLQWSINGVNLFS